MTEIRIVALIAIALMSGFCFGFWFGCKLIGWKIANVATREEAALLVRILERRSHRD